MVLAAALLVAGCGNAAEPTTKRSERLVDLDKRPPYVNSLEQDGDELLLTTNRGFYRIAGGKATKQKASITTKDGTASLGTFLELDTAPDGSLVGSGHPDVGSELPQYLGYLRSTDDGKTWTEVSLMSLADLHKIVFRHDRLYAWDAVTSAILISEDNGKTFSEHFTPRGLVIDFEVDPEDADTLLASTDDQLFRSTDGGDSWRPALREQGVRLAWPDNLYVATKDGRVQQSEDGGGSFAELGRVDGEPAVLKAGDEGLLMALTDGTVLRSEDGREWDAVFRP